MVDTQSPTVEIRRGKKERRRKKKPQGKNVMSASATQGGHKNRLALERPALLRRIAVYYIHRYALLLQTERGRSMGLSVGLAR